MVPVPPARHRSKAKRPLHVVVLEDDDEMRELLRTTLAGAGYEVVAHASGLELLERLERPEAAATPPIDLVVSDVRMPGVSGLCLLEGIRSWGGDPRPRMILITAFGGPELHAHARRLEAVCVLDKPFEMQALLDAVADALREDASPRQS